MKTDLAYEHACATARMTATATLTVTTQAQSSITYTLEATESIAKTAITICDCLTSSSSRPQNVRAARLYARRAGRWMQNVAEQAVVVDEAIVTTRDAVARVYEFTQIDEPRLDLIRSAVDEAIRGAVRAERAARVARNYLWQSADVALDAAQILDFDDLLSRAM